VKWYEVIILAFVGAMLFTWVKLRNARMPEGEQGNYPSTTAPVARDSLMLSVGFVHSVDAQSFDNLVPQPMESYNEAIPLASDYLQCDAGHAPAIAQINLGSCDPEINCWQRGTCAAQSDNPIGVEGPDVMPAPIKIPQQVSCNPNIPTYVPEAGVI
jgi:hypothetical protein